ncbi:hypothetical protein POSPLADRAFT_1140122 [Postia placenta MAD-698-R-SB12]|uniref:HNH nuclease domain-containing protein n=1 Tax=Postia placenta MAD-698-R-SB12 TaxID=670580 RepID=A0A1X6N5E1_9APHY|nr:hypothetical protein POSPLADRAFT_1140122 [Postia placenta MAD-698-R-SB12]OSX63682.1 hypothetical protein POSPLADRAFT_1140122 [Postia placenta MAD-698-R-SB12]
MVDGFKPRRSNRLKHLPKVDYCENKTADGKRKRGALDEEDEYTPSREGTPENQKIPTRAPENQKIPTRAPEIQRSPSRRVRRKTAITRSSRQRAIDASQNEGACIISGIKDKSVQQCHVLPRATKPDVLTALEWWWDITELSVDSRHNQVFRASSFQDACRYAWTYLHTVRADLHALWDRGYIAIMPMPDVMKEYVAKWKDGGRHKVLEASDEAKIHEYCVIPHPDLDNYAIREGFTYGFDKVGIIRYVVTLWLVMWHGLTSTSSCGVTALMGPEALDQDKRSKLKAVKPDGESCGSNLKLYAAYLAPTGSRCLLSLQDAKSVQGCHVVPRRTDDDTCARVAAWWGLDEFDVDSPFNIFLLRADIHCLWDQGHLMFVPEPHIVKDHLARSIVPIGGASSLAELFAASDVPVYRYCVVAHRDLPETEESAAFPRDIKILGYVESPIPPQLVIYKWGVDPVEEWTKWVLNGSRCLLQAPRSRL